MNAASPILFVDEERSAYDRSLLGDGQIVIPTVTVISGHLKVDDQVLSLDGVTEVRPEIVLRRVDPSTKAKQVGLWLLVAAIVVAMLYAWSPWSGRAKPMTLGDVFGAWCLIGIPWVFAFRMGNFDRIERYHRASVVLVRGGHTRRVYVGAFRPVPGRNLEQRMLNLGYEPETITRWKADYEPGLARAKAIAEAVGNAIGQKAGG